MSHHHAHLHPARWQSVRRIVFERDGWRCVECGRPGRLEAHHEPPLRDGADPYDLVGIMSYCRACHISRHRTDDMVPGRPAWLEFVALMAGE